MTDDEFEQKVNIELKLFAKTKRAADYPTEAEQTEIPKIAQRKAVDRIYKRLMKE